MAYHCLLSPMANKFSNQAFNFRDGNVFYATDQHRWNNKYIVDSLHMLIGEEQLCVTWRIMYITSWIDWNHPENCTVILLISGMHRTKEVNHTDEIFSWPKQGWMAIHNTGMIGYSNPFRLGCRKAFVVAILPVTSGQPSDLNSTKRLWN